MKRKVVAAIMSVALVAAVGIGGTLAYLSAQTDVVTNTFAVGSGFIPGPDDSKGIVLDETKVDRETGEVVKPEERVTSNAYEDLLPGDERTKDPTVSMIGGSVDAYVFVKIEGADALQEKGVSIKDFNTTDWTKVEGTNIDGIYRYNGNGNGKEGITVKTVAEGAKVVVTENAAYGEKVELSKVFKTIEFKKGITQEELDKLELNDLALQAVAVQADNNSASEALVEAKNVAQW